MVNSTNTGLLSVLITNRIKRIVSRFIQLITLCSFPVLLLSCATNTLGTKQALNNTNKPLTESAATTLVQAANSYILLSSADDTESISRNLNICKSYTRHFDPVLEFKNTVPDENTMQTYWLLNYKANMIANESGPSALSKIACDKHVNLYDFTRAKVLLGRAKLLYSKGPVLAAWSNTTMDNGLLTFDLTNIKKSDFDQAMLIWKKRIVNNPAIWNKGFDLSIIKKEFHQLEQKYGKGIVQVSKTNEYHNLTYF